MTTETIISLAYLLATETPATVANAAEKPQRRRRSSAAVQCQYIMKRTVHAVADCDDAMTAARIMRDEDVGVLPVCDTRGSVVGMLTDRDLAIRLCAADGRAATTTVGTLMTRGAVTCRPTHSIAQIERMMQSHRLTRILVTDEAGRPLGIVSLSDIAQYDRPARVGRTIQVVAERKYAPERP